MDSEATCARYLGPLISVDVVPVFYYYLHPSEAEAEKDRLWRVAVQFPSTIILEAMTTVC